MNTTPPTPTSAAEPLAPLWDDDHIDAEVNRRSVPLNPYYMYKAESKRLMRQLRDEYEKATNIILAVAQSEWQRQTAELQSQLDAARAGSYVPVEDGFTHTNATKCSVRQVEAAGRIWLTIDNPPLGRHAIVLPDDIRLCRLQPASDGSEGTVTDGIR